MRTTIEIADEHRARLVEMAASRGEKGFSRLVNEAIALYLAAEAEKNARRRLAMRARGALSEDESAELRQSARQIRESWR
jgi:predicted CopG family antitoxin